MPEFEKCFLTRWQNRAKEADLIIVNLTCFSPTCVEGRDDFGSICRVSRWCSMKPTDGRLAVFFGQQISNFRFEELARDAAMPCGLPKPAALRCVRRTQRIREKSRAFFDSFPPRDGRFPFTRRSAKLSRTEPRRVTTG